MSRKWKASAEVNGSEPFAEARGCAALVLIREMLEALECAEVEIGGGWSEPLSRHVTLTTEIRPVMRKAKKFLKQHNDKDQRRAETPRRTEKQ